MLSGSDFGRISIGTRANVVSGVCGIAVSAELIDAVGAANLGDAKAFVFPVACIARQVRL